MFEPGTIIITRGRKFDPVSTAIRLFSGSWWTHAFIIINETEAIEAWFPRVRKFNYSNRLVQLRKEGRYIKVLELPDLSDIERYTVVHNAVSYIGRLYDIWNLLYYVIFKSWFESGTRMVCSSLIARAYTNAGRPIFNELPSTMPHRLRDNLQDDYCTPEDILQYSDCEVVLAIDHK